MWAVELSIVTAVRGSWWGRSSVSIRKGNLKATLLRPRWRKKGPERLFPTPIQKERVRRGPTAFPAEVLQQSINKFCNKFQES